MAQHAVRVQPSSYPGHQIKQYSGLFVWELPALWDCVLLTWICVSKGCALVSF